MSIMKEWKEISKKDDKKEMTETKTVPEQEMQVLASVQKAELTDKEGKIQKGKKKGNKKKKKLVKRLVIAGVLLAVVGAGGMMYMKNQQRTAMAAAIGTVQTANVMRMDITSELSASSSLSPKDTYELTSLVEGEILEAPFEEGDVVEKGQILYVIDATSMDSEVSSAETSLVRAKENLQTAQEEYNEAVSSISGNTYKATKTGYIKNLLISEGDKVNSGTKIAEIYDDSVMKMTVPFLSFEADQIAVGSEAIVTLEDTGEQLSGVVTNVSSMEEVLSGGRLVKAVTIEVNNPGGLTTLTQATASVGDFVCGSEGNFTAKTEKSMTAELSGNSGLEIAAMLVSEGSYVTAGTPIFTATAKSVEKYIKGFEDNLESAKDNLENAENKLSNTQDSLDNYTITAPISGTVITKSAKVGDNITRSSGASSTLAVIYDLSAMTLQMSVDELDVYSVKAGQNVTITADALEGEVFSGTVTNVSLQSSYSSGVTNYPVTITMEETGDLLPGMNVDAEIILEESQNALVIPVGALMRGNRVYVKKDAAESGSAETADRAGDANVEGNASEGGVSEKPEGNAPEGGVGERPEGNAPEGGAGERLEGNAPEGGVGERPEGNAPEGGAGERPEGNAPEGGAGERPEGMPEGFSGERPEGFDGGLSGSIQTGTDEISQNGVPEGFVAVRVETGIINDDYVEILSGLSEGDEVYVDPNSGSAITNMFQMGGRPGGNMGGGMPGGNMGGGMSGGGMPGGGMGGRP